MFNGWFMYAKIIQKLAKHLLVMWPYYENIIQISVVGLRLLHYVICPL